MMWGVQEFWVLWYIQWAGKKKIALSLGGLFVTEIPETGTVGGTSGRFQNRLELTAGGKMMSSWLGYYCVGKYENKFHSCIKIELKGL